MLLAEINPGQSSYYTKIVLDYLNGAESLKPFYTHAHQINSFDEAIDLKKTDPDQRKLLVQVLKEQYKGAGIKTGKKVSENIESLLSDDTYTITTGHQLCLLTGPVYFIFKILHTIRLTEALQARHPGKYFVPVFWMASEDHDFEEINSIQWNGKKVTWKHQDTGDAVGRYSLEGMTVFFDELKAQYNGGKLPDFLGKAEELYLHSKSLSEATFKVVNYLFEEYGLVILEPDNRLLKQQLIPVMLKDVLAEKTIGDLNETNKQLKKLKYKLQIHGREINFFYLSDQGRQLIYKHDDSFVVGDEVRTFTRSEMETEINTHPEKFSPNVVLRPVYQEMILPNLGYVGGPGEVGYWLQLRKVFEGYAIPFPVVLLRNSFAILSESLKHKWEKLNLPDEIYFSGANRIHVDALQHFIPTREQMFQKEMDELFQQMIEEAAEVSNQMSALVISQKKENHVFFELYAKRMRKAKKERDKKRMNELYEIRASLFHEKTPSERVNNILHYVKLDDQRYFIDQLYAQATAVSSSVKLITY